MITKYINIIKYIKHSFIQYTHSSACAYTQTVLICIGHEEQAANLHVLIHIK